MDNMKEQQNKKRETLSNEKCWYHISRTKGIFLNQFAIWYVFASIVYTDPIKTQICNVSGFMLPMQV